MTEVVYENVNKIFPGFGHDREPNYAVRDLSLVIPEGEMVTLLGPSGCGKTTTLRMLAGFETPTTGRILVNGRDVSRMPVNTRGIGMMFQSYALFPHMTVLENIEYGLEVQGIKKPDKARRVSEIMELMSLEMYGRRLPNQLSGGQQQRVALARAVVTEPAVMLFDEPLSNLDATLRVRMRDELRQIQQRLGITSLYVTHDQDEAMAISDRVVVMNGGLMEQNSTTTELFAEPRTEFVASFIGSANIWTAKVENSSGTLVAVVANGHRFECRVAESDRPATGDSVRCVLRPEWMGVRRATESTARIARATYFGSHVQYLVEDPKNSTIVVTPIGPNQQTLRVGDPVTFEIQPGTPWIVPGRPV